MGKKKLELKLIRNPSSRHSTFYKRKSGLLKKAFELSVLCDAEVALIIFSETGKIYEFASKNDISRILAKYQIHNERARNSTPTSLQNMEFDEQFDVSQLKRLHEKMDILQKREKNMVGEDLESLTMKELQQLEKKLWRGLKCVHDRKMQIFSQSSNLLIEKGGFALCFVDHSTPALFTMTSGLCGNTNPCGCTPSIIESTIPLVGGCFPGLIGNL